MLVYNVIWFHDKDLTTGKGKCKECVVTINVLCRHAGDALRCFNWYFDKKHVKSEFTINDGEIKLKRVKIDSRGFNADYMMMDGIKEPLALDDLKSNITRVRNIFNLPML